MELIITLLFKLPIVFLITLLPKLPVVLPAYYAVQQFRHARRRKALQAYNYWYLGMAGYGFMLAWVQGLLLEGVWALWIICAIGCVASLFLEDRRNKRQLMATKDALRLLREGRLRWEQGLLRDGEMNALIDDIRVQTGLDPVPVLVEVRRHALPV